MTERSGNIIDDFLNIPGNDGPTSFVGFQDEAVVGIVMEEICDVGCATEGLHQDVEVAFPVGIAVGIVFPELVPWKTERSGLVDQSVRRSTAVCPREV